MKVKRIVGSLVALGVVATAFYYGCRGKVEPKTAYRKAPVERRDVIRTVVATGTVTPRNSKNGIPVGAQVNGKLVELLVDYNQTVTNGQVVARIDPLVYEASYKSAKAQLKVNEANRDVRQAALQAVRAELTLARKTYDRKKTLVEKSLASVSDLDSAEEALARATSAVSQAEASLASAEASVEQSQATVDKARADLEYCTIVSPVDGIVIDRKVEKGETVVSSMNAVPVLTIAEDLKKVWIEAKIPEAEVGAIAVGQPVTFTADAYRCSFTGTVVQVRKAASTTNNVVTFPVVIEADNPDEKLFPGMTATLSIETGRANDIVAVAAAALRFRPKDEDLERVTGEIPAGPKVWFEAEDGSLEPVAVKEGLSDGSFIQLLPAPGASFALEGREAIVGYEMKGGPQGSGEKENNPFMPKMPKRGTKGTAPAAKAK